MHIPNVACGVVDWDMAVAYWDVDWNVAVRWWVVDRCNLDRRFAYRNMDWDMAVAYRHVDWNVDRHME